ncbi:MAG TPA: FtsX-like permease family protein, partial [Rhodothermales bacterium]|nr:FtsX-like permease family protein [Rhodothermales bacterium]
SDVPTDTTAALLLNEAAVQSLGWDDPLGKTLMTDEQPMEVVGVLKDFHYSSLQEEIQPIIFRFSPDVLQSLVVRIRAERVSETLAFLEETWRNLAPAYPFEYTFLDQKYANEYEGIQRLSRTIRTFALLAILVACLGLFGLAAYTTEQRTKEIGVRKVLGASVPGILALLSRDFLKLVALAFVVAAPLSYFAMNKWLEDFAYRIEVGVGVFVLAGGMALLIAVATVSYQATRAALTNPVESLRYE